MTDDDPEPPHRYLGDHPDGAYWSAERPSSPAAEDDDADYVVTSGVIRFMWDYGVTVPLWAHDGQLPEDPEWLRSALGLSDRLVEDLTEWGRAMSALDAAPRLRTERPYRDLDERARALVERLRSELSSRFTVEYKPW